MTLLAHSARAEQAPSDSASAAAIASLCKALGDPLRLNILRVLSNDSFGVQELCQIFRSSQPGMSHHLKVLREAGAVAQRREGNSIFYRRALPEPDAPLAALYEQLLRSIDTVALEPSLRAGMQAVQAERAERSRAFFAENAERFRQHQELVADYELYGPSALEMVHNCAPNRRLALEVGPGEGAFLVELAPLFHRVCALDTSAAMLEAARNRVAAAGCSNVEVWQGDTGDRRLANLEADCVVLNMVLHHVSDPAAMVRQLAPLLAPDASLVVTELCPHDQAWTRERCGDVWLGLDPADLDRWAAEAGLEPGRSLYLAQRNGFRVQIRQFTQSQTRYPDVTPGSLPTH